MPIKLYVGNLSYDLTDTELGELFSPFGKVESARIVTDKFTGRSKGFGFVEMADREEAQKAIQDLNGKEVHNRALNVDEARPQKEQRGFGGRRPAGRGGQGGRNRSEGGRRD